MNHDLTYAEIQRLNQIDYARKLQARELNSRETFECGWLFTIILFLSLVAAFFS